MGRHLRIQKRSLPTKLKREKTIRRDLKGNIKLIVGVMAFLLTFLLLDLSSDTGYDAASLNAAIQTSNGHDYYSMTHREQKSGQLKPEVYEERTIIGSKSTNNADNAVGEQERQQDQGRSIDLTTMKQDPILSDTVMSVVVFDTLPDEENAVETIKSAQAEEDSQIANESSTMPSRVQYNHTELLASSTYSGRHVLFFHIYVPPGVSLRQIVAIEKQFTIVKHSLWSEDQIYYTMIGSDHEFCQDWDNCKKIGYYEEGWEEKTLTSMLRYCRANPDDTVAYIHNKGSFNDNLGNAKNRRLGTRAILSEACRALPFTPYNVCGLRFNVVPFFHFSTNFFVAKCSYVQNLVPPNDYPDIRFEMCNVLVETHGERRCRIQDPNATGYEQDNGFGRMAMERWIVSHPMLNPVQSHRGDLAAYLTGFESFPNQLYEPVVKRMTLISGDMRQMIKYQLKQFSFIYGAYALPGGCCEQILSQVDKPLCSGQHHQFESIFENRTLPLLVAFDEHSNATTGQYPWEQ